MPNPFPGVNPHIEAIADLWVGFHNVLIGDMSKLLNADLVSRGYAAVVDKRVELVETRDRPLPAPLTDADRAWVAERVAAVGR